MASTPSSATPPAETAAKRKSSVAGLSNNTRPVKRRASKACHCCRSRKVRCDVVESGIPCTNCRLDEVECQVTEGKRRKKSYIEDDVLNHSSVDSNEDKEEVPKFPLFDDIDGFQDLALPSTTSSSLPTVLASSNFLSAFHRPHSIYRTQGIHPTAGELHKLEPSINTRPLRLSIKPLQLPAHLQYHPPSSARAEIVLPAYISPVPKQMLDEDLRYLQKKGAFTIPEANIRNELLRSYVQYVHPYLPLLDLQEFLSAIHKDDSGNTVSLLLYHAVMFAASAYIDMRYLTSQGYTSRKAARKAYFQRVKLLYDFDWELDRITVVQSVLLMTLWYESPNDPKDVWYWLGIAVSIGKTIGLNYSTEGTTLLTPQKQRLWKRIWWSTYLRDRVIAIGMRRPIRIREEDYNVSMLQLEDFETTPLTPELCRMLGGCSAVRDRSKRETLAKMCMALTEVCRKISDVLSVQYSVLGSKIGVTSETTVRLVPRAAGGDASQVVRCDKELENWYNALPSEIRYFRVGSRERTNNHDGEVISVHRALLTAIYLTATSALHRPQMMPAMPNLVISSDLKMLSHLRVHEAALDITEIYRDLYAHDIIRYLPNTGVTVLLPAIIIHLLDIKSQDGADKQLSLRNFHFCMQALQKLRDLYASADFSFLYLDAAIKRSEVQVEDRQDYASEAMSMLGSARSRPMSSGHQILRASSALTPPPDNLCLDFRSNFSPSLNRRVSVLSPPPANSNDGANLEDSAISLKDLERFVDMNSIDHSHGTPFLDLQNLDFHIDDYSDRHDDGDPDVPTSVPEELLTNMKLESFVHTDASNDLFVPTQVNIDDSLFKDIDMEWLADAETDHTFDHNSAVVVSSHLGHQFEVMTKTPFVKEQLVSPPLSALSDSTSPSADDARSSIENRNARTARSEGDSSSRPGTRNGLMEDIRMSV